jgi:serine/threonine-protein kinase
MKDIFEVQDEIARSIAERLMVSLEGDQQERLVKAGTKNLEAYKLYLKGRVLLYRRAAGLAIPRALECFKQAVALDAEYALAWAGLADAYTLLDFYGFTRPEGSSPRGKQPAKRAVELDSGLGEAHSALAVVYLMYDSDLAEAEKEFHRALELNPRYIQARDWYALFYLQLARGRLEKGIAQAKLALESDPLSGYTHAMLGMTYSVAGRYAEALQTLQRGVELEPESFLPRWSMHWTLHLSGRFAEAVAVGEEVLASSGRHPWAMATLAVTLADWGKPAAAEALYVELTARARGGYVQPAQLAIVGAAAGRQDEALRYARESVEIRDASVIWFSKYYPYNARLRADPRFREILLEFGCE